MVKEVLSTNQEIKNGLNSIMWDEKLLLESFLSLAQSWIIKLVPTIEEKEIKILDIDKKDLLAKLEKKKGNAKKTFDWTVEDIFYDYDEEKSLKEKWIKFRIREKKENWVSKYYCTLKSKIISHKWRKKLKISHECEFEITDIEKFKELIVKFNLKVTQSRIKDRVSYLLTIKWDETAVVDVDQYHDVNNQYTAPFVEIEWINLKIINIVIRILWLKRNETFKWWANDLFKLWEKRRQKNKK